MADEMANSVGVAVAFHRAVTAMSTVISERPFPVGLVKAEVGDWDMTVNTSGQEISEDGIAYGAFTLHATHRTFFVIAVFDPAGGMIGGGMTEAQFIEDMDKLIKSAGE